MEKVNLEINFYKIKPLIKNMNYLFEDPIVNLSTREEVSVLIENKLTELNDENYVEILLFSLFAIRQITNFGVTDKIAHNLCTSLIKASEEIINLSESEASDLEKSMDGLGVDVLGNRIATHLFSSNIGIPVVSGNYRKGNKGFIAELVRRGSVMNFRCRLYGLFSKLGFGINYYPPTATVALLRFLVRKHLNNKPFLLRIANVSKVIGNLISYHGLSPFNQLEIGVEIADSIYFSEDGEQINYVTSELLNKFIRGK